MFTTWSNAGIFNTVTRLAGRTDVV